MGQSPIAYVVYMLMALVLVGSGVAAMNQRRVPGHKTPGIWMSIFIWTAIIVVIVILYQSATIWAAIGSLFR